MNNSNMGIYIIKNLLNNKIYVGSAVDLKTRKSNHFSQLYYNKHHNIYLQRSYNKHGKENFIFEIIEYIYDSSIIIEKEQYWMDYYKSYNRNYGYNIAPKAGNTLGVPCSPDRKKKIGEKNKGRKHTEETKKKMSESSKRENLSEETLKKMSEAHKKENLPIEILLKIKEGTTGSKNGNSKLSDEDIIKIKQLLLNGVPHKEIAKMYDIKPGQISKIKVGMSWSHIQINEEEKLREMVIKKKFLDEQDVIQIKILLVKGEKPSKIARKFGVDTSTISSIKKGETWKNVTVDGWELVLKPKKEKNTGTSKLTYDQVVTIKEMLRDGFTLKKIANQFNVKINTIHSIKSGQTWAYVEIENNIEYKSMRKLNEELVREIKILLLNGEKQANIARMFKVSPMLVSNINLGKMWANVKIS